MYPRRPCPAVTAGHRLRAGTGYDLHAAAQVLHAIEVQPAQMRDSKYSRPTSLSVSSCSTTTPKAARHDQDLGDPDRDRTTVPMRNELRDREPAVSTAQPLVQDDVVSVSEAQASIDAMEKGLPWMAGGYPGAIGVSDLIVDPGETASRCPVDEGAGLPVHPPSLVLLIDVGRLRPGHHRQLRQTDARADALVRIRHPRRGPDQLARQRHQPGPVPGIEPSQERMRTCPSRFGMTRLKSRVLPRAERDEWSVDIQEEQRRLR